MIAYEGRLNSYLHRPVQVLALDADELRVIFMLLIAGFVFGGTLIWTMVFFAPFILIPYKREQARGFYSHAMVGVGLSPLYGYPPINATQFYE